MAGPMSRDPLKRLVLPVGIEPTTSPLPRGRVWSNFPL
jgi:hypothetical protein